MPDESGDRETPSTTETNEADRSAPRHRAPKIDPVTYKVYEFVRDYHARHRKAPTFREIADGCYVGHTTVYRHVERLCGMGWLERDLNTPRSIIIGELAPDYKPTDR